MSRLRCYRWYCLRHNRNHLATITDFSHHGIKSTLKRRVIVGLSIPELVPQPRAQDETHCGEALLHVNGMTMVLYRRNTLSGDLRQPFG